MRVEKRQIGTIDEKEVYLFTLKNTKGSTLKVMSYGATATEWWVPNHSGEYNNVLVSPKTLEDYQNHRPFHGSVVGPVAGRIAGAHFDLNGQSVDLDKNEENNHLHGGEKGWDTRVWDGQIEEGIDEIAVIFTSQITTDESGYPGNISAQVRYALTEKNEWILSYEVKTDAPTILNPTNHVYFNLNGRKQSIYDHTLELKSSHVLALGEGNLPTGEKIAVSGTPFDFIKGKPIREALESTHPQIQLAKGLDHAFLLDQADNKEPVVRLSDPMSGRQLKVFTDRQAVVIYTHNHKAQELNISQYEGIAFETQMVPDAIHSKEYKEFVIFTPDNPLKSKTTFQMTVIEA